MIDGVLREAAALRPAVAPEPAAPAVRIWTRARAAALGHVERGVPGSVPAAEVDFLNLLVDASLDRDDTTLAEFAVLAALIGQVLAAPTGIRAAAQEFLAVGNTATALGEHRRDPLAVRLLAPFARPLGLREPDVAGEVRVDASTVRRHLWDLFGCGFNDLRWAALIRHAIAPAARTTVPIGSIAIDCGCVALSAERQFHRAWLKVPDLPAGEFGDRCAR